jgi:hypothetical protein
LIDILFVDVTVTIAIGLSIFQSMNAERYAEEVAQGLHSKGAKAGKFGRAGTTVAAVVPGAKRHGRPPKGIQPSETGTSQCNQMGLGL